MHLERRVSENRSKTSFVGTWVHRLPVTLRRQALVGEVLHYRCCFGLRPHLLVHLRKTARPLEVSIAWQAIWRLWAVSSRRRLFALFLNMPRNLLSQHQQRDNKGRMQSKRT